METHITMVKPPDSFEAIDEMCHRKFIRLLIDVCAVSLENSRF